MVNSSNKNSFYKKVQSLHTEVQRESIDKQYLFSYFFVLILTIPSLTFNFIDSYSGISQINSDLDDLIDDESFNIPNGYNDDNKYVKNPQSLSDVNIGPKTIFGTENWISSNTYIIKGNIIVNGTLSIQPGTIIKFDGVYNITINGKLFVNGTTTNKITFQPTSSNAPPGSWGGLIINSTGTGKVEFALIKNAIRGVYLNNTQSFRLISNYLNQSSEFGIVCNYTNNIVIMNNSLFQNGLYGIQLKGAENSTIQYNSINAHKFGIYLTNTKNNFILNNSLSNWRYNGYDNSSAQNLWEYNYYGNYSGEDNDLDYLGDTNLPYTLGGSSNTDFHPRTKVANILLTNNQTQGTYASLSSAVIHSGMNMFINVTSETPNAGSQTLFQDGYYYENIIINSTIGHGLIIGSPFLKGFRNTTIDGNGNTCIMVDGDYKLILGMLTIVNSKSALHLRNGASDSLLTNLRIIDNENGIKIENCTSVSLDNSTIANVVHSNTTSGLQILNSSRIDIDHNRLLDNDIGIDIFDSHQVTLFNNTCDSNVDAGIQLIQSSNCTLIENTINSNIFSGLRLLDKSNENDVINNSLQNNLDGIELNNSKGNYFESNIIQANPEHGIKLESGADNNTFESIPANSFSGSDKGLLCNSSQDVRFLNCSINYMKIWLDNNSTVTFLNTNFNNQYVLLWDPLSVLTVKNYLTIRAVNQTNAPIPDGYVEVRDNKTNMIAQGNTDLNGEIPLIPCISYIQIQNIKDYSANNHTIKVNDSITEQFDTLNVTIKTIKIFIFNYAPVISEHNNFTAIEKKLYSVKYNATTSDINKSFTWSLKTNTSSWLRLDQENSTIFGIPHNRDVGQPWVNVSVRDLENDLAFHRFTLKIINTPPAILTTSIISTYEDDLYFNDYNSTDDDGYYDDSGVFIVPSVNLTTWSFVTTSSDWLTFDNETGILQGIPDNTAVGSYDVLIFVDDGHGGKNSSSFKLEVLNTPPDLIGEDILEAYKNKEYFNDYNSSDDGLGDITWELHTNANWLLLNNQTGVINGSPKQDDVGEWWVNISVIDDHGGRSSRNFTIEVFDPNQAPRIISKNRVTALTNTEYRVVYEASDLDTPQEFLFWELNFDSGETNATWLQMEPTTGILKGTPLRRHVGWYWVNVTVFDNAGGLDFSKFRLDVLLSPDKPPSLDPKYNRIIKQTGDTWIEQFTAVDDYTDHDKLKWFLHSNAQWLNINNRTGKIEIDLEQSYVGEYWVNVSVMDDTGNLNFTNFTLIITSGNNFPRLFNAGISPQNGTTETMFTFWVWYSDRDNDSGTVYVVIDGKEIILFPDPKGYSRYYKGINYSKSIKLTKGKHNYYFWATDGRDQAILDKDVPGRNNPAITDNIEEITKRSFWEQPEFWLNLLIYIIFVVIILICVLLVLRKMSKIHPKLEFVNRITLPDSINPVARYHARLDREEAGDYGLLCPNCGAIIQSEAKFCTECDESFVIAEYACPSCDEIVDSTTETCPSCGEKFEDLDLESEEKLLRDLESPDEEVDVDKGVDVGVEVEVDDDKEVEAGIDADVDADADDIGKDPSAKQEVVVKDSKKSKKPKKPIKPKEPTKPSRKPKVSDKAEEVDVINDEGSKVTEKIGDEKKKGKKGKGKVKKKKK